MKAETKHTPGPWKVGKQRRIESPTIGGGCIIVVSEGAIEPNDANLIAAAPEMLAALEAVLESFIHIPGSVAGNKLRTQILARCENVKTALNQARAAISKAKGNA